MIVFCPLDLLELRRALIAAPTVWDLLQSTVRFVPDPEARSSCVTCSLGFTCADIGTAAQPTRAIIDMNVNFISPPPGSQTSIVRSFAFASPARLICARHSLADAHVVPACIPLPISSSCTGRTLRERARRSMPCMSSLCPRKYSNQIRQLCDDIPNEAIRD